MVNKAVRSEIIAKFARSEYDTGSMFVQIALLDEKIRVLGEHMKRAPKDYHSKTGLMKAIGRRRRSFNYIRKNDFAAYEEFMRVLRPDKVK